MKFDRTRIAIRPRGFLEILDMSSRVMRIYIGPLIGATFPLGLTFAVLNAWLLRWIVVDEYSAATISRFVLLQILFVYLQAPIVTLPTTALLGRVMFSRDIEWRSLWGDLQSAAAGILWSQGIVRGGWLLMVLMAFLRPSLEFSSIEVVLVVFAGLSAWLRAIRPFINEIVLLERNPIRRSATSKVTIGWRSRALHRRNSSELIGRAIVTAGAAIALGVSLWLSLWFFAGLLYEDWTCGPFAVQIILPFVLWLAAIYTCVVRFLSYLDLRIRREGWEVELKVRAAAQELVELSEMQGQVS